MISIDNLEDRKLVEKIISKNKYVKSRDEKVIVTGGAGLIGSLVDRLVNDGAHVIVVDDFSKGKKLNLKKSINNIEIREGNLENFSSKALLGSKIIFSSS